MKKFSTAINGYDKNEVNSFVTEVTMEYEKMLNKLKLRDKDIDLLQRQLSYYRGLETTLNKAVLIAEDSSNQIRKVARDEAKVIIENARKNASHIVNDALIKAEKIELETDQLRRSLKRYKARIRQAVQEQLSMVEDIDNINLENED